MKKEDFNSDNYESCKSEIEDLNVLVDLKTFDEDVKKLREKYGRDWWEYPVGLRRTELEQLKVTEYCESIGYVEPIIHCNDWQNPIGNTWLYALIKGSDKKSCDAHIEMRELYTGVYKCRNVRRCDYPMMYCQCGY